MRNKRISFYVTILTVLLLLAMSFAACADSVPRMSTDELKSHLGNDAPIILDVRANGDWAGSNDKIVGAERVDPRAVDQWADNYVKEKVIVLYCA